MHVRARKLLHGRTRVIDVQLFMRLHSGGLYKESVLEMHRDSDCGGNLYPHIKGAGEGVAPSAVCGTRSTQVRVRMHATFSANGALHAELVCDAIFF